jgi:DNA-binding IclR family transcriptional regulator
MQLLCGCSKCACLRDRDEDTYIVEIQFIHAELPRSAYSLSLASIALAQFYLAHIDLSELARKHLFMKLRWTGKESVKRRKDMEGQ